MAFKVLIKEKPDFVVSTGAGVGVPFIYAGKLLGIETVYIESRTRVKELSLTGRLVLPVVDHLVVRWPELSEKYKKCEFAGSIS